MADTWFCGVNNVMFSAAAPMSILDLAQDQGGTLVLRVYKIEHLFTTHNNVSPQALVQFRIARAGAGSGSTPTTWMIPAKRRSASITPPVTAGFRRNCVETSILRQYIRSVIQTDFTSASVDAIAKYQIDVPWNVIWESGLTDSSIQPLTIRAGESIHVRQITAQTGINDQPCSDVEMEFTSGTS